jgi:hypothetical protein
MIKVYVKSRDKYLGAEEILYIFNMICFIIK